MQCRLPTVFIIRNMYREECVYSHTAFWIDTDLQTGMQSDWVTGYWQPSSQSQAVIQAGRFRNRQAGFLTGMLAGGVKAGMLTASGQAREAEWQGVCHTRFSTSTFFMIRTHLSPWYTGWKYFRIWFRFRRDFRSQSCLRGVLHAAEIKIFS